MMKPLTALPINELISEAESELSKSAFSRKISKENKAINKMKKNPKYFYIYVKSQTNKKSKIGPFLDKKGKIINEHPAETLSKQYSSV